MSENRNDPIVGKSHAEENTGLDLSLCAVRFG